MKGLYKAVEQIVHLDECFRIQNLKRERMASVSGNIKGFYRQKKNTTKSSKKPPLKAASFGSDVAQPPALVSHGGNLDLQGLPPLIARVFSIKPHFLPCFSVLPNSISSIVKKKKKKNLQFLLINLTWFLELVHQMITTRARRSCGNLI